MLQLSPATTSPALSDKSRFKMYLRTNAPETHLNPAKIKIFKEFGWSNIATIHQTFDIFSVVSKRFEFEDALVSLRSGMQLRGKSFRSWRDGSSDRSFMVDPLSYFSFQPVLHDWCNKGRGMYYPVCGMMYIKEPLLLIGKSSLCGGSGFSLSLSEWSFIICPTPYNRK